MKSVYRGMALIIALALLFPAVTVSAQDSDPEAVAQQMVDQIIAGDYAGAVAHLDPSIADKLPADKLQEVWTGIVAQAGAYQSQTGIQSGPVQGNTLVVITLQLEKAAINVQVVVNAQGKVVGLFFTPSEAEAGPVYEWRAPEYADPARFSEQEITLRSGKWELPGTLTLPLGEGPFPALVLVPGSGPNDRDETVGPNKPFKDLAWGLASQGIAVLRYDKRTKVYGAQIAEQPQDATVQEEFIDDALAAIDLLKATPQIDPARIFLLGHSEGGYVAPRIAQQSADLAGIVILAGHTRPLEDLILEQSAYLAGLDGEVSEEEQAALDQLEQQVQQIKELKPGDEPDQPILGAFAVYWLDLAAYDPLATAQGLSIPMLILQGERDYQVTLTDFQGWQDALSSREEVTFHTYPALNHLMMAGEGPSTPDDYGVPGHVDQAVIRDIAGWIADISNP